MHRQSSSRRSCVNLFVRLVARNLMLMLTGGEIIEPAAGNKIIISYMSSDQQLGLRDQATRIEKFCHPEGKNERKNKRTRVYGS